MAVRWMCGGGRQPVRVVHGDGQVLSLLPPVKVADILDGHPHHYICHMSPDLPSNKSAMLPVDYDLEPGYVYFLLPLPRLFPTSASGPPSCCCRASNHDRSLEEGHTTPNRAQLHNFSKLGFSVPPGMKSLMEKLGSPMRSSPMRGAAKKVSPELSRCDATGANSLSSPLLSPSYGSLKHSKRPRGGGSSPGRRCMSPKSSPNRLRENAQSKQQGGGGNLYSGGGRSSPCFMEILCTKWKPELGCISETDAAVIACEELRLCLDRRRLTFDARMRPNSPVRLSEVCRIPRRETQTKSQNEDGFNEKPAKHMPLASFIFA